jgi:Putative prokaryotic signal transducing protein
MEWITVFKTKNSIEAEMCKAKLQDNNINAVIFDKKDSVYPVLGELQVKVVLEDQEKAGTLIANIDV